MTWGGLEKTMPASDLQATGFPTEATGLLEIPRSFSSGFGQQLEVKMANAFFHAA